MHEITVNGWQIRIWRMSITWFLSPPILDGTGVLVYASPMLERWYPQRLDIVGSSHWIMHSLIILRLFRTQ